MNTILSVSKSVRKRRRKRWFEGMSRVLLEKDKHELPFRNSVQRLDGFDIEAELTQQK